MNLVEYAKNEFEILRREVPNAIVLEFENEILNLVEAFANSGQSGASAPYTAGAIASTLKHLFMFKPITDITGKDDEWVKIDHNEYQNKRLSSLFKKDNDVYYIDAIVWQGEQKWDTFVGSVYLDNNCKTVVSSRQYINGFPFKPKTFYVDTYRKYISKDEITKDLYYIQEDSNTFYITIVKDINQLKEVFEYYRKPNGLVITRRKS